ncbi:MAG TPA: DUF948 domain-containing protein [Lactobacillaceae bacterium]|jgi:uncharacterized protein YoxC
MSAGMVAALAFLLLVIFIGIFLMRLVATLATLTRSVDIIARSSVDILANANTLLDDVNGKVKKIDPTFQAVADLSGTVSDLNAATRKVTSRLAGSGKAVSAVTNGGLAVTVGRSVAKAVLKRNKARRNKQNTTTKK